LNDRPAIDAFIKTLQSESKTNWIENIAGRYPFAEYYAFLYKECAMMFTIDSAPCILPAGWACLLYRFGTHQSGKLTES
jgi:hypothetical protein